MFRRKPRVPEGWEARAQEQVPGWAAWSTEERDAFADTLAWAYGTISWEPVADFELSDDMRLTLALSAATVGWNLHPDHLRMADTFIVWPEAIERRPDPVPVAAAASWRPGVPQFVINNDPYTLNGPLALSWAEVANDVAHPERGRNAVMRAVAIAIDLADGSIDGTPDFGDEEQREAWIAAALPVFERLDRGESCPPLPASAGEDAAAFLAAVTEAFFLNGAAFAEELPELYGLLVEFFGQDPVARTAD